MKDTKAIELNIEYYSELINLVARAYRVATPTQCKKIKFLIQSRNQAISIFNIGYANHMADRLTEYCHQIQS